jgi:hypothetical protein
MEIKRTSLEKLAELDPKDMLDISNIKIKDEEVFVTDPKNIKIHSIAEILPKMSENEYKTLKESIKTNGQFIPVYLYRNKLVDGRHRLKALRELGSNMIKYTKLPNNWTIEEVKEFILGTEQRRHETKAQLAIRAFFHQKANGGSQQEVAIKYGVDRTDISRAKKIEEKLGTDILKKMLKDRRVILGNGRYYSNLKSIIQYITSIEAAEIKSKSNKNLTNVGSEIKSIAIKAKANNDAIGIVQGIEILKKALIEITEK